MDKHTAQYWFSNSTELVRLIKYKPIKTEVIEQTSFLKEDSSLPQRLWHIINETNKIPGCKTCDSSVSWDKRYKKYKTFCGDPRCPNVDIDIIKQKQSKLDYSKIVKKRQETCIKKYGNVNYLASKQGKDKVKQSFNSQSEQQKNQRYKKVKQARLCTMRQKYGVDNISLLFYNSQETFDLLNNKEWLREQHHTLKKSQSEIATNLEIAGGATVIGKYLRKNNIEVLNPIPVSIGEKQIKNWLITNGTTFISNDRTIIKPHELDIFLPEYNLAIEYCGLYWHSEQQGKDKHYHENKWKKCKEKGIQLLTIFEDEWMERQEQIKQKILSLLNKDNRKITYARKCQIVNVTTKTKRQFFEDNHIQGDGPGSINIGLTYDNELVACMSFIKQKEQHYLNRYATSIRVVGGFSKLLKYFQNTFEWKQLISFADIRWSNGNLYKKTGWKLDKIIEPDYYYSPDGHKKYHKFNYRRKNLPNLLRRFDSDKSEKQNCNDNGILRIWDCGKLRYMIKLDKDNKT